MLALASSAHAWRAASGCVPFASCTASSCHLPAAVRPFHAASSGVSSSPASSSSVIAAHSAWVVVVDIGLFWAALMLALASSAHAWRAAGGCVPFASCTASSCQLAAAT